MKVNRLGQNSSLQPGKQQEHQPHSADSPCPWAPQDDTIGPVCVATHTPQVVPQLRTAGPGLSIFCSKEQTSQSPSPRRAPLSKQTAVIPWSPWATSLLIDYGNCSTLGDKSHSLVPSVGLPRWLSGKESARQCRRCRGHRFDPWLGKIPWSRKRQLTPVFLPGKSQGQRIFQARILEWAALSFSGGSSQPRNQTSVSCVSCIASRFFTHWAIQEKTKKR